MDQESPEAADTEGGESADSDHKRDDERHWTETHPDRELWSTGRRVIAEAMTQEEYEALFGRGNRVEYKPRRKTRSVPGSDSDPPSHPKKPRPPRFFYRISEKLGFSPEGVEPRPPRMPTGAEDRGECAQSFWGPETDGDRLNPEAIRYGFPPDEEEVTPSPNEDVTPCGDEEVPSHNCTPDSIAYYHPWHIGGDEHWGIYFRVRNMDSYIRRIERLFGYRNMRALLTEQVFWHEMEHFEQEKAAFLLEDLVGEILYPDWLHDRFNIPVFLENRSTGRDEEVFLIEEALATAREVEWAERQGNPIEIPLGYPAFVREDSARAPTGYNRFHLCLGTPQRAEARAAFIEAVCQVGSPRIPGRLSHETANRLFGNPQRWRRDKVPVRHVID